jgi:hypothetical protein
VFNLFLREEIQRIKARHPSITHKEAFSAASKNVSIRRLTESSKLFRSASTSFWIICSSNHYPPKLHIVSKLSYVLLQCSGLTYLGSRRRESDDLLLHAISRFASCKEGKVGNRLIAT